MPLLHPGDQFPELTIQLVGGSETTVADTLTGRFGVVLFNRGSWCPYCNTQLRGFQRAAAELDQAGAGVVSLSVDDEPTTRALIEKFGLTFPVGHSADAAHLSELTGAFVNPDPTYVQATGFVLDPSGTVLVSVYSSGAIGRLTPEDTLGFIRYVKDHA